MKAAREEWDEDSEALDSEAILAKWRNVSVDDLMYAERIHFNRNSPPNLSPPIIEAAMKGHSEIVQLLLEHGADVEILTKNLKTGESGNVSLAVAAR